MNMLEIETLRNRVARIIAVTRFPFVDQLLWNHEIKTIVNDEAKRFAIKWEKGVLYPNLVITNPDGTIGEIGTVEISDDTTEESIEKWRVLSDIVPFGKKNKKLFLYVPDGNEERTKRLLDDYEVDYDGIRAYRVENQTLKVIPVVTHNDEYDHTTT